MITVSITRKSSNANWSCRNTPIFFGRDTLPLVGSISPVKIFIKVDLPAPFGPVIAYRRPAIKVVVTSSNSTRAPYRIDILLIEIIALNCIVKRVSDSTRTPTLHAVSCPEFALTDDSTLERAGKLHRRSHGQARKELVSLSGRCQRPGAVLQPVAIRNVAKIIMNPRRPRVI